MDRGVKNLLFCGRHKWMTPKEDVKFKENYNFKKKLYDTQLDKLENHCVKPTIAALFDNLNK